MNYQNTTRVCVGDAETAEKWMDEQLWKRYEDWIFTGSVSYPGGRMVFHYNIEDKTKAMLLKLTLGVKA
jgi:hypothetical protein